jgi:hypothetical protein
MKGVETPVSVIAHLTRFLWITSFFFKIRRTVECVILFFLATSRDHAVCDALQHISHFFVVSMVLQSLIDGGLLDFDIFLFLIN